MADRYKQMQSAIRGRNLFKQRMVSDYSFVKSLIFAKVNLPKDEFNLFKTMFTMMHAQLPQPEVVAILDPGRVRQEAQIVKRGRSYEQSLPEGYLDRVAAGYAAHYKHARGSRVLGSTPPSWTLWPNLRRSPVERRRARPAQAWGAPLQSDGLMKGPAVVQPDLNPLVDVAALPLRGGGSPDAPAPGVCQSPSPGVRIDVRGDWPGVGGPVPLADHARRRTRTPSRVVVDAWAGPGLP